MPVIRTYPFYERTSYMTNERLRKDVKGACLVLTVLGEIDHHTAKGLREAIDAELFYHRPKTLKLVLSEVAFMDSSGLGLILGRYTRMRELGGTMILVEPTRQIEKILSLAAMDKTIAIEKKSSKKGSPK